ncbi:MAG TPA: hypothetical protein VKG84_00330 [Candidatus Acidoferrales bacterium]|nr:hypothetical protein [Candidatus Acidoferrales bacterium]
MTSTRIPRKLALTLTLALASAAFLPSGSPFLAQVHAQASAPAQEAPPAAAGSPVRITVTAMSKAKNQEPPALEKGDFLVYEDRNKTPRPITNVIAQKGEDNKLDFYIVVDNGIDTDVTLNYPELGAFVRELPTTARVGVLYANNGTFTIRQDLTSDRDAALKTLAIPNGQIGVGGGIFLSLVDLAKRLPPIPNRRYAILFLSSGIDTFRGLRSTAAGLNTDLDLAVDRLNRAGITVYSIFVSPAAHFARSFFLVTNGQSCLSRLADETGGEAYFQGFGTPISMKPFLEEMGRHLSNQYLVTFAAKPRKKPGYAGIKVRTEMSGVELDNPSEVYVTVPGSK